MNPDRSSEVREEAFRLSCSTHPPNPSWNDLDARIDVCRDLSSTLRDCWSNLISESRDNHALDYCSALQRIAKAPESHRFLFRDQWIVVNYVLAAESSQVNELAEGLLKCIRQSLSELMKSKQDQQAKRAWLILAREHPHY